MASIFSDLKEKFGIVSPVPLDPTLRTQLEKRGMNQKIAELEKKPSGIFDDLKKKFNISQSVLRARVGEGLPPLEASRASEIVRRQSTVPVEERKPTEIIGAIARAPIRAITSIGLEPAAGAVSLAAKKEIKPEFRPRTGIERFLLGEEPVKGIFSETEEVQKFTETLETKLGLDPYFAKGSAFVLAPLFVAGMKGLDLTPIGGGDKKLGEKLAKNLVERYGDEIASLIIKKGDSKLAQQALTERGESIVKNFVQSEAKEKVSKDLISHANELATIAKKAVIPDPEKRIIIGVLSEEKAKALNTSGEIRISRKAIKHIVDNERASMINRLPDVMISPEEILPNIRKNSDRTISIEPNVYTFAKKFGTKNDFAVAEVVKTDRGLEIRTVMDKSFADYARLKRRVADAGGSPVSPIASTVSDASRSGRAISDLQRPQLEVQKTLLEGRPPADQAGLPLITQLDRKSMISQKGTGVVSRISTSQESLYESIKPQPFPDVKPRERGFVTSVRETIPELRARVAGQYIPRDTDELAMKARNLIKDDIDTAENLARTGTDENAVAVSAELVKHYSDEAAKAVDQATKNVLYDKAAEIANLSAQNLTELGQSVQAASILGRLTPEGQLRFAAREIQRYNETVPLRKKIPSLTGEQAQKLLEESKRIIAMPDGIEKMMAFRKFQNKISDLAPSPFNKKFIAIWKAGLLTGLKTSGLNTFSNLFHGGMDIVKDVPGAAVDSVAALFTGERKLGLTVRGTLGGIREGFEKGFNYLKTGFDERDVALKLDYKRVHFDSSFGKKVLQPYEETIFRVLGAEDQPFYYGAKARSLQSQAIAQAKNAKLKGPEAAKFIDNLVQNPTDEMLKYAVNDAEMAVFQNKTALGKIARKIQEAPGGEVVVPFGRTPAAVATQIINYSPVGIVKTIIQNAGRGKFDQRLFSQGIGRGITGTAILMIGAELFKNGLLNLNRPTGEKEQKQWELEGRQPNTIKIGDKYRSVNVLGPAGIGLVIGGYFSRGLKESGSVSDALMQAFSGVGKALSEQTFLLSIKQMVDAWNDPVRYGLGFGAGLLGSAIPTIVSDVARATDTKERRTEGIFGRLESRIPGVRQTLEPQIDVFGRERQTGGFLETMIDPTRPSAVKNDPLTQELRRLLDSGYKATPTQLGAKYGFKALTPRQNTALWVRAGELTRNKLSSLIQTSWYKKADDEQRTKQIGEIASMAGMYARAEAVLQLTKGLHGEELKKELSRLKADGILTKTVYEKFWELR